MKEKRCCVEGRYYNKQKGECMAESFCNGGPRLVPETQKNSYCCKEFVSRHVDEYDEEEEK